MGYILVMGYIMGLSKTTGNGLYSGKNKLGNGLYPGKKETNGLYPGKIGNGLYSV